MTSRSHSTEPPGELASQAKTKCFPYQHGKSSCHTHSVVIRPKLSLILAYSASLQLRNFNSQSLSPKPSTFFKRHVSLWGDLDRIFKIQKRLDPVMLDTFTNDNKVKVINNLRWLPINGPRPKCNFPRAKTCHFQSLFYPDQDSLINKICRNTFEILKSKYMSKDVFNIIITVKRIAKTTTD